MEAATPAAERSEHGLRKDALLGVDLMILWRLGGHRDFFGRRPETVAPDVAAGYKVGIAAVPEEAV
jgi:hypothetical protein